MPAEKVSADREEIIEKLESAINEAYCREGDDGVPLVRDLLRAALADARAPLEARVKELEEGGYATLNILTDPDADNRLDDDGVYEVIRRARDILIAALVAGEESGEGVERGEDESDIK